MILKTAYNVCFSIPLAVLAPHPWKILHSNDSRIWFYTDGTLKATLN